MKNILIRISVIFITFLVGVGLPIYWFAFLETPSVALPQTNIGCNFADSEKCRMSIDDRKYWVKNILSRFYEKAMEETEEDECYRLIVLPTFHNPLAVVIRNSLGRKSITIKKLSRNRGIGTRNLGDVSSAKQISISDDEWQNAKKLIEEMEFWNTSEYSDELLVNDGVDWSIEGKRGGSIHAVHRRLPDEKFGALCSYLLKLSGFQSDYFPR
jgi:hypothetical protein